MGWDTRNLGKAGLDAISHKGVPGLLPTARGCQAIVLAGKAGPAWGGAGGASAAGGRWKEEAVVVALGASVTTGAGQGRAGV